MKFVLCLVIQVFLLTTLGKTQNKFFVEPSLIVKVTGDFKRIMGNNEIGNAFTLVVFNLDSAGKFSKISVVSTNKVAQKVIESYLDSMPNPFEFYDKKVGNFALPIVQIVLTETSEEEVMSWKNNNTWALARFAKQLQLPQQTILLNPIYTAGDVSIHH
jgi:hypothetical protein